MKSYLIKILCIIPLGVILGSCNKFLDIQPSGLKAADNYIIDEETALNSINAAYNNLAIHERWNDGTLESNTFYVGEMMADFADMGSHKGDYDDLERMMEWRPYTDEIILWATWNRCYDGIYRCEYVLENIYNAPINKDLADRIAGEAYFIKAINILRLATMFAEIPISEGVLSPDDYGKIPQKSLHESFEIAASLFKKAEELLPLKNEYSSKDLGRATKGAAQTMLARLYMWQAGMDKEGNPAELWQNVYDYTTKVIASGQYSLTPNYAEIFEPEGENNCESIFEIQLSANSSVNSGNGSARTDVGSMAQIRCGIRAAENEGLPGGWGYYQPNQLLVDEFEEKDARLTCAVYGPEFNRGIVYGVMRNYNITEMQSMYYNRHLAVDPVTEAPLLMTTESNGARNVRVARYADVILMHAEAAYNLGKEGEAIEDLETIRARARASTFCKGYSLGMGDAYAPSGYTNNLPKVNASGKALEEAIWHERAVELALEDVRYFDLVRTGRYLDRMNVKRNTVKDPTSTELRFADIDIKANCSARCIEGPRGIKDIPVFPLPGDEAIKWNLKQVIDIYK